MKNQAIDIFNKDLAQPFPKDGYDLVLDSIKDIAELERNDSAQKKSEKSSVMFAPFCLLRIAALPYEMLGALRTQKTLALVEKILLQRKQLNDLKTIVEDILHSLVPRLAEDEVSLRRLTIKLKRDVHNGRLTGYRDNELDQISERLLDGEKLSFTQWRRLKDELEESELTIDGVFFDEQQNVLRPNLRAALSNPLFQHALAYGSAGVARSALTEKKLPTKFNPDSLERSLLGYLIRAAAKTSPFSSFMYQTAVSFIPTQRENAPKVGKPVVSSRTRLNRGIPKRLHRAYCQEVAAEVNLPLQVNASLSEFGEAGRLQAICNRDIVLLGRPWCEQRYAQFRLDEKLADLLIRGPQLTRWNDFLEQLITTGITRDKAQAVMLKLYQRGILLPPDFTDAYDAQPEQSLLEFLQTWASKNPQVQFNDKLNEMRDLVASLSEFKTHHTIADTQAMLDSLEKIRALETESMHAVQQKKYDEFQNMVLEDCWVSGVQGEFGDTLAQSLADLADFLSTQVAISTEYGRMLDAFIQGFGEGGTCNQVTEFLLTVGNKLIDVPEFGAKVVYTPPKPARSGIPIGVTAQIQLARDEATGTKLVVVNRVFNGLGWLSSRFGFGATKEQELLRNSLSDWLCTASATKEPVDLILNGDSNDLQAHPRLTRRVLAWPGEPLLLDEKEIIRADQLVLRHNTETNLLELFDNAGTAIDLNYLGSTFPSPAWGVPYALSILTQPFQLMRPDTGPPTEQNEAAKDIIFNARITHGNTILRRATWWVKSSYLKNIWFQKNGAQRLLAVSESLQKLELPEIFFAQKSFMHDAGMIGADALDADRKPLWVDAKNSFCLSLLERITEKCTWVSFTEALPGKQDNWFTVDGKSHVTELQVEMQVHAK